MELLLTLPPLDHQVEGVLRILQDAEGFLNLSEMGTGKSYMTIAAMNELCMRGKVKKVLVVCPATLKYNWLDQFKMSLVPWRIKVLEGAVASRITEVKRGQHDIYITNYEALPKMVEIFNKWGPDLVVADEVHTCKDHTRNKSKAIKKIKAKYRWGLTGTLTPQSPLDVWSPMDWIRPGHLQPSYYAFRNYYANVYTGAGFPIIRNYKNQDELRDKLARYSLRYLKSECLDLPDKMYEKIEFDLDPKERRAYQDMLNHMVIEFDNEQEVSASTALVRIGKLQQITSGFVGGEEGIIGIGNSKLKALEDVLDSIGDQKVIVWCKFREEMKRITDMLAKTKRSFIGIHGDVNEVSRADAVKQFQTYESPKVFVCMVQVGGLGLTLTAASYSIYFSNSWSLADRLQSEDRNHRIGTKNKVTYYDLVAKSTIDAYVLQVLQKKQALSDRITGDELRRMANGQ
jgi:SNF2 family DNA or RNA helicase